MSQLHPDKPLQDAIKKAWGWFQRLHADDRCRLTMAVIRQCGESSVHRHEHQDNAFQILSGCLIVTYYTEDVKPTFRKLISKNMDEYCLVPAGVKHSFRALEDTVVLELYLGVDGFAPVEEDIVRETS